MMAHVDLCSGIGGFALGFEWAGLSKPVLFCDIEPWSRKVLAKHWPDVPIAEDVKELANDPTRLVPDCDILTAGYPCQPFSVAGKQRGTEDDRHIWPFISQIIAHKRPAWCVLENVYGHVALGLDEVLADLEAQDYATRAFIVPACGVNAPHRRDRLWIIAHTNSHGEPDVTRFAEEGQRLGRSPKNDANPDSQRSHRAEQHKQRSGESADRQKREFGSVCEDVADTRSERREPSGGSRKVGSAQKKEGGRGDQFDVFSASSNSLVADTNGEGLQGHTNANRQRLGQSRRQQITDQSFSRRKENVADTDSERGRLRYTQRQDAEDAGQSPRGQKHGGWDFEPSMGRMADGLSEGLDRFEGWEREPEDIPRVATGVKDRVSRLKGLGNAIVPSIAMQIGLTIKAVRDE